MRNHQVSSLWERIKILKGQFTDEWALSSSAFALLLLKTGLILIIYFCGITVKLWKRQYVVCIIHALFFKPPESFDSFIWRKDWHSHYYSLKSICLGLCLQTESEQMTVFNLEWTFPLICIYGETSLPFCGYETDF